MKKEVNIQSSAAALMNQCVGQVSTERMGLIVIVYKHSWKFFESKDFC